MDAARIVAASVQIPDLRSEEVNLQIPYEPRKPTRPLMARRARHHGQGVRGHTVDWGAGVQCGKSAFAIVPNNA
jgi:hypothetical protein